MTRRKKHITELHAHISSSISPSVMWSIAHGSGIKLPTKDFFTFQELVVLSDKRKMKLKEYLDTIYHPILNPISSGTYAVEKAVHETLSGAYRSSGIHIHELRLNPMKHNSGGQQDMDHIIMAALRGMERALLEYQDLKAGLIFCMDRQFSKKQNEIIARKAIKYKNRGVVGIDFANYNSGSFFFKDYEDIVEVCKSNDLGVTAHTGETEYDNDIWDAVTYIKPDRIGHGIKAAYDTQLMKEIVKQGIVLEICPMSNLVTKAVKDIAELTHILHIFIEHGVKFTINTDWPETVENAHLDEQFEFLEKHSVLTDVQLEKCLKTAEEATFIKKVGIEAYL